MSDGLVPPVNAPQGQAMPVGVQPGASSAVVVARQVIVFGPSGTVSGLFEYAPGTVPGLGNPPVLAISSASTDPFGNSIRPPDSAAAGSLIALGPAGSFVELAAAGASAALLLGTGNASEIATGQLASAIQGAGNATQLSTTLKAPKFAAGKGASLFLTSASFDGGASASPVIVGTLDQGGSFELFFDSSNNSTFLLGDGTTIKATRPGGPIDTPESWHPITLDTGWSLVAGSGAPSYRLLPDGNLQLTGIADAGSALTANKTLNSANPLPAAYRPLTPKLYRGFSGPNSRGAVTIAPTGIITMLVSATYPAQFCEIDGSPPLNL